MTDFSAYGFDSYFNRITSFTSRTRDYISALEADLRLERSAYAPPTLISSGTISFQGSTTGTLTGVTVGTVSQTGGTISSTLLGTSQMTGGTAGTITIIGGTANNQIIGTPSITGGTIVNSIINTPTIGTPAITGGTVTNSILNTNTIGTPAVTGGTINNATLGTPAVTGGTITSVIINTPTVGTPNVTAGTFSAPRITGTPVFDVNAGSAVLGTEGALAIQTYAGSAILVARLGTITYYFASAGTLA